jgi:hypothetical protein
MVYGSGGWGQSLLNKVCVLPQLFNCHNSNFLLTFVIRFASFIPTHSYQTLRRLYANLTLITKKLSGTMADAMEITLNEGTPALSTPQRVAPVVHMPVKGDGQNWPSASEASAIGASTTPKPTQRILVQASSAVSSITNVATSSSGGAANRDDANNTPKKRNVLKQKFPDFSCAYSDDNPFLSGDESGKWEVEEENVMMKIAEENAIEELTACNLSDPVEEVAEMDYLLENIQGEEGNADDEAKGRRGAFETVLVKTKTYTVAELKEVCKAINIPSSGNKTALFQRIQDSGSDLIEQINDKSFYYRKKNGEVDLSLPHWVILNSEPAPTVRGVDMLCGAEEGFFGPMNQENAEGAPKYQYCCSEEEKICRPEFASKTPNHPVSKKGHISPAARKLLPDEIRDCRPKHFFDTQISPDFVKRCIVNTTNA